MVCVGEHCVLCALLQLLNAIQLFGANLDDYLHLLLPPIVKLFDAPDVPLQARKSVPRMHALMLAQLNVLMRFKRHCSWALEATDRTGFCLSELLCCVFFIVCGVGLP